jgi:glycosyltransferase involved in cell wall biosynthesis
MTKKVLIVGMLDSIHLARWLAQFQNSNIEFLVFPSKTFRAVHPKLIQLVDEYSNFKLIYQPFPRVLSGYIDFALFGVIQSFFQFNLRSRYLEKVIRKFKPQFLHALEIQGGGYLCDDLTLPQHKTYKLITTNWGSDIFYFRNIPEDLVRIKSVLSKSDYYSAECQRDYLLAESLGFKGVQLPCIPNAGGFSDVELAITKTLCSKRTNIVVKAYGGNFGRGELAINVLQCILAEFPDITTFLYSVTDELMNSVSELSSAHPGRVSFSTQRQPMGYEELKSIFLRSRVYVGCSISDGISTSFLESLITGAYPIQTSTSCAGEWLKKGAVGTLIPLEEKALAAALREALTSDRLVDEAQKSNLRVSKEHLSYEKISQIASTFYAT